MKVLIECGNSAKKVDFEDGTSFESISCTISSLFSVDPDNIKLQIFDKDFDAFCDLDDVTEIKHLCRIKVIEIESSVEKLVEMPILSSDDSSNLRRKSWKAGNFSVSQEMFSLDVQKELSTAGEHYLSSSSEKLHKASYQLKREIMDILSKELCSYALYPTKDMYKSTTEALIKAYPFLRDPIGDGTCCWSIALKYKMQEIRRKAKVDEVKVNAGKQPKDGKKKSIPSTDIRRKGLKKARKGEVNYNPEVPDGETLETLMAHKAQLLDEFKKREPCKVIMDRKMELTYSLRRREIVQMQTTFEDFKKEWPMLFSSEMLRKEMIRLVGSDVFPKINKNLKNKALIEKATKKMLMNHVSEEAVMKSLPKLFKENWSFYIESVIDQDSTCLFSEDLIVDECVLPPHPVMVETSSGWSIMAENVLLMEDADFVTAASCLICIYHIFDINYHPAGQKCMLFLSVALAEIPSAQKLPVKVHNILASMKLSGS